MGRKILAVCFDFGDTLADEASEVKDETLTTLRAELIPGAGEVVKELYRRGYTLALIADGQPGTYANVLKQHGLQDLFTALAISELVGVEKPDKRMFVHALDQLGIEPADYPKVMMVGNRLDRDVRGANNLGIISVWLDWSPRNAKIPVDDAEKSQFTIKLPEELLGVIADRETLPLLLPFQDLVGVLTTLFSRASAIVVPLWKVEVGGHRTRHQVYGFEKCFQVGQVINVYFVSPEVHLIEN
jgi:putative hydrolase of the HAD superfamily